MEVDGKTESKDSLIIRLTQLHSSSSDMSVRDPAIALSLSVVSHFILIQHVEILLILKLNPLRQEYVIVDVGEFALKSASCFYFPNDVDAFNSVVFFRERRVKPRAY